MKKLNLLFILIVVAVLTLVGCSKKNVFGKTNDGSSTGNGVGNLIISPTPATYGNTITITGVNKNIKFSADDIEVFFTSITSGLRYDVNNTFMTIIPGHPDTLRFILPTNVPMDAYLVKVVYNKTNDTLSYNGYAVLDAEVIKNAVIVTSITPSSVDISQGTTITISGNNFSSDASKDTVILLKNGIEMHRWNGTSMITATGTAISFSIPQIAKLISDIKTVNSYDIKLKVDGKNSDQTGLQSLTITNSQYPTFSYEGKSDGTNAGTFVTLLSGLDNTKQVYFSKINTTAPTQITAVNNGSFFMPQNIDADNYYIKIKQLDGSYFTAINATTKDSIVIVKPFVTDISFSPNTGGINTIPVDYPFDFTHTDSVFDIAIKGANLVKNSAVAFDMIVTPTLTGTLTPTTTNATEIVYKQFSTLTQAGNITISLSNNATELANKSFAFYQPVIDTISPVVTDFINPTDITITGKGIFGTTNIGFSKVAGDTIWIPINNVDNTNRLTTISNATIKDKLQISGNYVVILQTNGTNSVSTKMFTLQTNDGPTISQIDTKQIGTDECLLAIKGSNFPANAKLQFYEKSGSTFTQIAGLLSTKLSSTAKQLEVTFKTIPGRDIQFKELYFEILGRTVDGTADSIFSDRYEFSCIKAVEMYEAPPNQNKNYNILYAKLLSPGSKMAIFGDNLKWIKSLTIEAIDLKNDRNFDVRTIFSGSRLQSNNYVLRTVNYLIHGGETMVLITNSISIYTKVSGYGTATTQSIDLTAPAYIFQ